MRKIPTVTRALTTLFAVCALSASMAHATNIDIGQWYAGQFFLANTPLTGGNSGSPILDPDLSQAADAPDGPWDFVLGANGGVFIITDLGFAGDQFAIFDKLIDDTVVEVGTTSAAPNFSRVCSVPDPDIFSNAPPTQLIGCSLLNDDYSTGRFDLLAGAHSITGDHLGSVDFGDFAFFVQENKATAIPGPSVPALISVALIALYRKSRTA